MIIWINGAWGAGKTTTAVELHQRLENSFIFDPEEAGFYINKTIPKALKKNDFQDFKEWRQINTQMIKLLASEYKGTIIIPMTLIKQEIVDEIIGSLKAEGYLINHYLLETNSEMLHKRLSKRFESQTSWARSRIDEAIEGLERLSDIKTINTNDRSIEEVVDLIARDAGLLLKADNRKPIKKKIDRFLISFKETFS